MQKAKSLIYGDGELPKVDFLIYGNLIERHNFEHSRVIKYMISGMMQRVGKPFSIKKFYNDLKSQAYAIGNDALYEYAGYLKDAYLAFALPACNPSTRKLQTTSRKLYAIDAGLVRALMLDYELEKWIEQVT